MKKLSTAIHLYIVSEVPNFTKRYKLMYSGESFVVYSRKFRNGQEDITVFKTSDKCIRLVRTFYILNHTSGIEYKSFRSYAELVRFFKIIVI